MSGMPSRRWVAAIAPPCLRNRLFPKSVHASLGVVGMADPVPIYLQDFNSREG